MTDNKLDYLLNDWAARHTLPSKRADAIRHAILAASQITTTELSGSWWRDFSLTLTTTLRQSTYMAPTIWYPAAR